MAGKLPVAFVSFLAHTAALLAQAPAAAAPDPVPVLDGTTFAAHWQHVVPNAEELASAASDKAQSGQLRAALARAALELAMPLSGDESIPPARQKSPLLPFRKGG